MSYKWIRFLRNYQLVPYHNINIYRIYTPIELYFWQVNTSYKQIIYQKINLENLRVAVLASYMALVANFAKWGSYTY
jgi:hypothetical protein